MLHGSHLMVGLGLFLVLSSLFGFPVTPLGLLAAVIGSLVPDIDHPKSFISHWNAFTRMISNEVSSVTGHRGFTHTLYSLFIWILLVALALNYCGVIGKEPIMIGAALGYFSHLLVDSLNPQGVHWLGKKGGVHLKGPIDTGGKMEKYLIPVVFLGLILVYMELKTRVNTF